MAECKICGLSIGEKYGHYCRNCYIALWQLKELLFEPYLNGRIDPVAKRFLIELDFLFMRNMRVQGIFNLAWQMWLDFVLLGNREIDLRSYAEFEYISISKRQETLKILISAKVLEQVAPDKVKPGQIIEVVRTLRLSHQELNSPLITGTIREARAIITIAITFALIDQDKSVPRDISCIMEVLSQHMFSHINDEVIPEIITKEIFEKVFKRLPPRQNLKMRIDLIGLNPSGARVISDVDSQGNVTLKKSAVKYLEFARERWRERERGRER